MDVVLVGKVLSSFGLHGWVKVRSLSDVPGRFSPGASLWIGTPEGGWREIVVEEVNFGDRHLLVRFSGFSSREDAEKLQGLFLAVSRKEVPSLPEDHFYHFELIGLTVEEEGVIRGRVVSIIDGPSYDWLVVVGREGGEFLLPFIRAYVQEVKREAGIIRVICPPGFWE